VADIVINSLSKSFPASQRNGEVLRALVNVGLQVGSGELIALIGPSGSGKTTLLRLIAGLEEPDAGSIAIGDRNQAGIPPGERDVAMVFQTLALYPHLNTRENMVFGLKLRNTPTSEMDTRAAELSKLLGIQDCLSRRPAELSSGQRQRVALGRALIRQPKVLLLDEPFANLDAPLRRELRRELLRLHQELKLTVIFVTHDQVEAMALGQRVAVMNAGRIEQVAKPDELRAKPVSDFVKSFLATDVM